MFAVPTDTPTGTVSDAIAQLHALECATLASILDLVIVAEERELWKEDGANSTVGWIAGHCNLSFGHAKEFVRVAKALVSLPLLSEQFRSGRLSWDQLVQVTKFADASSDAAWAEDAPGLCESALRRLAKLKRPIAPKDDRTADDRRAFYWYWIREGRSLALRGELPADMAAQFITFMEREMKERYDDLSVEDSISPEQMRADILADMAMVNLELDHDAERSLLVIHAELRDLLGGGNGFVENGPVVSNPVLQMFLCDSYLQPVINNGGGIPIGVGRQTRHLPLKIRRLLKKRDNTCRFPGCGRAAWLHEHHIKEWVRDEGPSDLDNMLMLCSRHHRMIHVEGWTIEGDPNYAVTFIKPNGDPLCNAPPLRDDIRKRFKPILVPFEFTDPASDS